jgi:17beta-estradiol 17-dehydrogenase / very-long-chain 3-oxoacyl-CoA reductase
MLGATISNLGLGLGSAFLSVLAVKAVRFYTLYFWVPQKPLQKYRLEVGAKERKDDKSVPWALITGSSAGIGFGYAQYLLSLDFGVVILAEQLIEEADAKLRKAYPDGHIKSFDFDCLTASVSDIEKLLDNVKDLPITILINNVGSVPMEHPKFRQFRDFSSEGIENHWKLNAGFMTHITRLMLPILTKNAQPRSLILNVSSGARTGIPYLSMYSATKGYVTSWSHTLTREFRYLGHPIDCLLVVPGDVVSHGNNVAVTPGSPHADEFAKMLLDRVDGAVGRGLLEISPYWKHALQMVLLDWLPEGVRAPELVKVIEERRVLSAKQQ